MFPRPLFQIALCFCLTTAALRAAETGYVSNISSRVSAGTGDSAIISGFIVSGAAQQVIVRALGPTLARFGVAGALQDPVLELHDGSGAVIATNDNWADTQAALFQRGGAYRAFQPPSAAEPAIAVTLQPGSYSAVVRGKNGGTGVALAEVYVAGQSSSGTVSNMSTRAMVGTGDNVLIGGVTISGTSNVPVILRALGPTLTRFGVANALSDPALELHDSDGDLIGYSNDWRADADQLSRITRAGYAPPNAVEPALAITLAPGNYTAIVRGYGNATGVALLETYQVQNSQAASEPTPTPTPAPIGPVPPMPHGVFSLVQAGKNADPSTLSNPNVDGLALRQAWSELEPGDGAFDWSYLDAQIARAQAAGKQITLRIGTGGDNIPVWVMNAVRAAGGSTFAFTDSDGKHTIPVFWDATFLAKKKAMIAAVGARYSSNPAVKVFSASFANASSDDWAVPHNNVLDSGYAISEVLRWQNAGYTSQRLIDAGGEIINAAARAFPNQLIALPINSNGGALDEPNDDNYVSTTVIANARNTWGSGRLVAVKNSLSVKTPAAAAASGSWSVLRDSSPAIAAQALWFSFGDSSYRNNGGTASAAATSLQQLVDIGAGYGVGYVELYEVDVINLPAVIAHAHSVIY